MPESAGSFQLFLTVTNQLPTSPSVRLVVAGMRDAFFCAWISREMLLEFIGLRNI